MKSKADSTKSHDDHCEYVKCKNYVNRLRNERKNAYFNDVSKKYSNNGKKLWKEMQQFTGMTKNDSSSSCCIDSDKMNDFFVNVGNNISQSFPQSKSIKWKNPACMYEFKIESLKKEKILKHLLLLDKNSNTDVQEFDTRLLQIAAPYIYQSLTDIFNSSIQCRDVPEDWKLARTTPIYKGKGSRNEETNYRPISVVSHIPKIIEKEIQEQLLRYLLKHNLINIEKHAFLPKHSTTTCLHEFLDAFNEKEKVGACFLDISKCFDSVYHDILLFKMQQYGIAENMLRWFSSYLEERKQVVFSQGKRKKRNCQ